MSSNGYTWIGDMMAESRTARLRTRGEEFHGNLMEEADGTSALDVERGMYSAEAEDQLLILHVFDLLCGQVDRNKANLKYITGKDGNCTPSISCVPSFMKKA